MKHGFDVSQSKAFMKHFLICKCCNKQFDESMTLKNHIYHKKRARFKLSTTHLNSIDPYLSYHQENVQDYQVTKLSDINHLDMKYHFDVMNLHSDLSNLHLTETIAFEEPTHQPTVQISNQTSNHQSVHPLVQPSNNMNALSTQTHSSDVSK